jgi:transcriptional regulator with XRE-family HTH domain
MEKSALGLLLQKLREAKSLSFRELADIAKIDHAYIYRLETGAKESPSEEVMAKLTDALGATTRDADMLRYLARFDKVDPGLVEYVLGDSTINFEEFTQAASIVYRGGARLDYAAKIRLIRRIQEEEDNG